MKGKLFFPVQTDGQPEHCRSDSPDLIHCHAHCATTHFSANDFATTDLPFPLSLLRLLFTKTVEDETRMNSDPSVMTFFFFKFVSFPENQVC
jgi:hypothetical protein